MNLLHGGINGYIGQFDGEAIAGLESVNRFDDVALGIPHQAEPPLQQVLGGQGL